MAVTIYSYSAAMDVLPSAPAVVAYPYSASMSRFVDVAAESVGLLTYRNSVWDTQKAGSDKTHYWDTSPNPDPSGTEYDGPGTWGIHTSGHSAKPVGIEAEEEPNYHAESNLWTPPGTPHVLDEEFNQSTLGSEWYNWSIPSVAYGTLDYNAVDTYDTTFTTGDALRINVNPDERRSWAILQPPSNRGMILGKPCTLTTNMLIVMRAKFLQYYITSMDNFDRQIALWLLADSGGAPDLENRVNMYLNDIFGNELRPLFFKTYLDVGSDFNYATNATTRGQAIEYVAIQKLGTTYHGWAGTAGGNWIWMNSFTHPTTMAHVGVFLQSVSTNKPAVGVLGVDFIRFYETDNFLF